MSPAERVIKKCGGHARVAELVGLHVSRIHRWTYPKGKRGGTGGLVPSHQQQKLLEAAREQGIELTPADFFDLPVMA